MEWVMGTVEEALSNISKSDFLFVVFIDGADELSDRLLSLFIDQSICNRIQQKQIKVFRIYAGTASYEKFLDKYKTVPIPSIFFLDRAGDPINLITSDISSTDAMAEKFDRVIAQTCPNLHLISPHFEVTTERALVTEVSSSSSCASVSEAETQLLNEDLFHTEQFETAATTDDNDSLETPQLNAAQPFKRIEMNEFMQTYLAGGQDLPEDSPNISPVSFSKLQKDFKAKSVKVNHPPLTNLIFRFESGDSRSQYFTYKTQLSTVREYISQVLKRESDIREFFISTTFPSRVLVPELDKATMEDLGLFPSAMINVHFTEVDRVRNVVLKQKKSLLERLGGLSTIATIAVWTALNPIMVGTNWLGLGEYLFADEDDDEFGGFFSNIFSFQEMIDD